MKKILASFIVVSFLALIVMSSVISVRAADSPFITGLQTAGGQTGAGYATDKSASKVIAEIIGNALNPIWVGVAGMLFLIYGGYIWMLSRGREQEVERAKEIIKNTILALVVIFAAWAIVKLIIPVWEMVKK